MLLVKPLALESYFTHDIPRGWIIGMMLRYDTLDVGLASSPFNNRLPRLSSQSLTPRRWMKDVPSTKCCRAIHT